MTGFSARGLLAPALPPAMPNLTTLSIENAIHHHQHVHNNTQTDNGPVLNAIREVGDEFKTLKTRANFQPSLSCNK